MQWKGRIGKNCKGSSKWPNRIGCERKEENGRERELEEIRENRRADKREMGWKYREREREKKMVIGRKEIMKKTRAVF